MSTLWTAASVTATNGSNLITVQSGEDIAAIRTNSWIMVGSAHIMEIKRTFVTDSGVKTIELFDNWEFGPASGQRATVAPSLGEFKTLADDVRRLIQIGEEQINTASVAPEPGSSVKRSENGTVKTAEPQDDADAVRLQDFAPVKQKGESNEQAISSNSLAILRQRAMAKLERDAVFLAKFTEDRVVKSAGLSKIATSVAEGITISNLDGITGIGPDGRIYDSGVGNVPIVYDSNGQCQGLQTAPSSTNLLLWSEDFTQSVWDKVGATISANQIASPVQGVMADKLIEETSNGFHQTFQSSGSYVSGDVVTSFFIAKAAERNLLRIDVTGVVSVRYSFNLNDGSFSKNQGGADSFAKAIPLFDGFYMLIVGDVATSAGAATTIARIQQSEGVISYTGDGSSGLYLAAAQLEQGYPTPYIKTEASQVTRGDVKSLNNFEFNGPFYIYAEFLNNSDENEQKDWLYLDDGNTSKRIFYNIASTVDTVRSFDGDTTITVNIPAGGKKIKALLRVENDTMTLFANGNSNQAAHNGTFIDSSNFLLRDTKFSKVSINYGYVTDAQAIALTTLEQ